MGVKEIAIWKVQIQAEAHIIFLHIIDGLSIFMGEREEYEVNCIKEIFIGAR